MAKVQILPGKGIKPKALAKQLLPVGATPKQIQALTDKILANKNNQDLVRGQKIAAGTIVSVGKKNLNKPKKALTDKSTTNKFDFYKKPTIETIWSTPDTPAPRAAQIQKEYIKPATPEIILLEDQNLDVDIMADLIFENIGGQEVINIARNDTVSGQNILYQPIKNLSSLGLQYNSKNILAVSNNSETLFGNFPIKLELNLPEEGTGPNKEFIYLDSDTGDIIINVINLQPDEQVEVQFLNSGIVLDDTIYGG